MDRQILLSADRFILTSELKKVIKLFSDIQKDKVGLHLANGFLVVLDRDTGNVWLENNAGKTYEKAEED